MRKSTLLTITLLTLGFSIQNAVAQSKQPAKKENKVTKPAPKSQEKGALFFDQTIINFGTLVDQQDPITYTFNFKNIGKGPIKIINVKPDCNCSAASWSQDEVPFQGNGKIEIKFYPYMLSGKVSKNIMVYTDGEPNVYFLTLEGYVDDKFSRLEKQFSTTQGNMRFDKYQINFEQIFTYESDSVIVSVYNPLDKPIEIKKIIAPDWITFTPDQNVVNPQNNVNIKIKFNALLSKDYGNIINEITMVTNDPAVPEKKYLIRANITEDFSKLTPKQQKRAPVMEIITPTVDLDTVNIESKNTVTFYITNKGKDPMFVRKISSNCGCTVVDFDYSKPIKRNKKTPVKITYNTGYDLGKVNKTITFITNTPDKPVHTAELKANVMYLKK